jgi:L-fucose isomerase-like protein
MRNPKALVIPFKFREGYPDKYVDPLIASATELIDNTNINVTMTKNVVTDGDADFVAKKYNACDYDLCVLVVPTWFEPVTLIRAAKNFLSLPVVVWGFSNFVHEGERVNLGSSAGAGVAKGTLRELGVYHKYIYFSPGIGKDDIIKEQLWKVANVGRAASLMDDARILTVGYQFGGMTLGDMDLTKMRSVFGPDLIELDSYTLINSMNDIDVSSDEYKEAQAEVEALLSNSLGENLNVWHVCMLQ